MRALALFSFTIREAVRRGTLVFYFLVATLIILFFALALRVSAEDGSTILLFGKAIFPKEIRGFPISGVEFLLFQLQKSSSSSIMLFGIFAVAGLIPSLLERGTVELFLSKPLSRTSVLLSRALGATGGVALNMIYFVFGIWLVFGIKLGVWHWGFLLSSFLVSLAFALYFSVVVLCALITRSGGLSIMFAFLYSLFSSALQSRKLALYPIWENEIYRRALDVIYYATPQISDMLDQASLLIGKNPIDVMRYGDAAPTFDFLPFVYSLLSASAIYALSAWYFSRRDF